MSATQTVLAVAIGVALLHVFYRAVEFRWPDSYIGAAEVGLYAILSSPGRYISFRTVPVYVVCVLVAASSDRAGLDARVTSLGVAVVHGLATNGRTLLQDMRVSNPIFRHRLPFVLLRALGLVSVVLVGLFAAYSYVFAMPLVPTLNEISEALWTALLAGVFGAYVVKVASGQGLDTGDLIARSYASLDTAFWDLAEQRARVHGADARLLRAIMLVENVQRPAWIRTLEYAKARIAPAGTYGIMQVASYKPISDEESIDKAALRLRGVSVWDETGVVDYKSVVAASNAYNPDPGYQDLLFSALYFIESKS